ncbi:MAG: ankyrin repeat domain-containing protein [Candidatus Nanopelagicales bacterium]
MSGGNWKDFYLAAREGDLDLVKYHVQHGVDVDYAHPEFMSTALVAAIMARHQDVAQYLIDSGADPNLLSDLDELSPVEAAAQTGMTLRLP